MNSRRESFLVRRLTLLGIVVGAVVLACAALALYMSFTKDVVYKMELLHVVPSSTTLPSGQAEDR